MSGFLIILAVGLGTYVMRAVFIVGLANRRIPPLVITALEFVAPAVLAALVVSMLVQPDGRVAVGAPEMAGLIAGGAAAYFKRNFLLAAVVGMTAFWVVRGIV